MNTMPQWPQMVQIIKHAQKGMQPRGRLIPPQFKEKYMNPEEIQEHIAVLEQRISQRVQLLSKDDPQIQRMIGQMEGLKVRGVDGLDGDSEETAIDADDDRLTLKVASEDVAT
jgi:hypothetical protein